MDDEATTTPSETAMEPTEPSPVTPTTSPTPDATATSTPDATATPTADPVTRETTWRLVNDGPVPVRAFVTFSATSVESFRVTKNDSTEVVVSATDAADDPRVFDDAIRVGALADDAVTSWAEAEPTAAMYGTDEVPQPVLATVVTLEKRGDAWVGTRYAEYSCEDGQWISEFRVEYDENSSGVFYSCYA